MKEQEILRWDGNLSELDGLLSRTGCRRLLLVCGASAERLRIAPWLHSLELRKDLSVTRFSGFSPNPEYGQAAEGTRLFLENGCDGILAVGGGSAMDVAKCIKLFAVLDPQKRWLDQKMVSSDIPLIAVPTTAGSGAETTRFAVIYDRGVKQSVGHVSCIPDTVVLDPTVLATLPDYQRKATFLDALCHAVESCWSVHATAESRVWSDRAIRALTANAEAYMRADPATFAAVQQAAYEAGRAINITQTTAGHAMCYKLTGLYGLAHGHAAALCVRALWPRLARHDDPCVLAGGEAALDEALDALAAAMGADSREAGAERFAALVDGMALPYPAAKAGDLAVLCGAVNPERLQNHPSRLDRPVLEQLYRQILSL